MNAIIEKKDSFYKTLVLIALPITLQSLLQASLTILDGLMVGQLGEQHIATIALSNRFFYIYQYIIAALVGGAAIFISQFWGKEDTKSIVKTLKIPLLIGIIALVVFGIIVFVFPSQSIGVFTKDKSVIADGAYLQKLYYMSALPLLLTNIYAVLLRSTCNVKLPMIAGIISIVLDTILNYVLIFGKFGFEALGAEGAVISTVIARWLEALILFLFIYFKKKPFSFRITEVFNHKLDKTFKKCFWKAMWPLLTLNLVYVLADTIYSRIYGLIGTNEMAAMSILFPIQGFSIGLFSGLSSATGIILGNKLGSNKTDTAVTYAKKILRISTLLTLVIAAVLVLISDFYLGFFNISVDVYDKSKMLIYVAAIFLCVRVLNMIIGQGIIQSGGDTKYILFLDIIGMWCIGVPLAYLAAFVFHLPIYVVYCFVSIEEAVRMILGLRKVRSKEWAINLVDDISA